MSLRENAGADRSEGKSKLSSRARSLKNIPGSRISQRKIARHVS